MFISRRKLLIGLVAAPAIVRIASLMPVRAYSETVRFAPLIIEGVNGVTFSNQILYHEYHGASLSIQEANELYAACSRLREMERSAYLNPRRHF